MTYDNHRTMFAQVLGRDFALLVDRVETKELSASPYALCGYVAYTVDGDGNLLFEIAASPIGAMILDRLDSLIAEARARMTAWQESPADWLSWPSATDDFENTPGPIPDGRVLQWVRDLPVKEKGAS